MQRHSYLTRRSFGSHPGGSKCFAFRRGRKLTLEFMNKETIELPGDFYDTEYVDRKTLDLVIGEDLIPLFIEDDRSFKLCGEEVGPLNEAIMEYRHWAVPIPMER